VNDQALATTDRRQLLRSRLLRRPTDPATALFGRIRWRLTLLFAAVLAAVLLISGTLLYVGMRQTLLGPTNSTLQSAGNELSEHWVHDGRPPCLLPPQAFNRQSGIAFIACYDNTGKFIGAVGPSNDAPGFLANSLAQSALASGSAFDEVDAGPYEGQVRRYAVVVRDPDTQNVIGVAQAGVRIGDTLAALDTLQTLLLLVGALTLLGATVGGYFLAARALDPARLAFARQQGFIADAAHELRTPLTLLRADAEVLLRGRERFEPDDAALLEDIVAETGHLSSLSTTMLTLARLDSGAQHHERDIVDLASVAASVVQRVRAFADERNVTLTLGATAPAQVIGDRELLEQAALILVDNAIKYGGEGSAVTVSVAAKDSEQRLVVHDTGPGIAAEHLPHLGERFYRPDKARSRAAGGAGLGLSLARGIMKLHDGDLTVESAPGKGTTATLILPSARANTHTTSAGH
jgi:two-component system, OmpR family, sensor histidine kinase CiaH